MRKEKRRLVGVFALIVMLGAAQAFAQDDPEEKEGTKIGPVDFHVVPEIGAGVLLRDDQIIEFDASDAFVLFRIPGLRFPGWNETVTGLQIELTSVPSPAPGSALRYDIVSYTRTKIAGPAYTGANVRIAQGTTDTPADLGARVMPVIGIRMFTISEHVPFSFEVELFDQNRPVKAAIIITWQ